MTELRINERVRKDWYHNFIYKRVGNTRRTYKYAMACMGGYQSESWEEFYQVFVVTDKNKIKALDWLLSESVYSHLYGVDSVEEAKELGKKYSKFDQEDLAVFPISTDIPYDLWMHITVTLRSINEYQAVADTIISLSDHISMEDALFVVGFVRYVEDAWSSGFQWNTGEINWGHQSFGSYANYKNYVSFNLDKKDVPFKNDPHLSLKIRPPGFEVHGITKYHFANKVRDCYDKMVAKQAKLNAFGVPVSKTDSNFSALSEAFLECKKEFLKNA